VLLLNGETHAQLCSFKYSSHVMDVTSNKI